MSERIKNPELRNLPVRETQDKTAEILCSHDLVEFERPSELLPKF